MSSSSTDGAAVADACVALTVSMRVDDLPESLLRRCFSCLPPGDLAAAAHVSRRWHATACSPPLLPAWYDISPRFVSNWRAIPADVAAFLVTRQPCLELLAGPDLPGWLPWPALAAQRFGGLTASAAPRGAINSFLATLLQQEALMETFNSVLEAPHVPCVLCSPEGPGGGSYLQVTEPHAHALARHPQFMRLLMHEGAPRARQAWFRRDVMDGVDEHQRVVFLHARYAGIDIFQHRRPALEVPLSLPVRGHRVPVDRGEAGSRGYGEQEERVARIAWRGPLTVVLWYRVAFPWPLDSGGDNAAVDLDAASRWMRNARVADLLAAAASAGALLQGVCDGGVVVGRALLFCAVDDRWAPPQLLLRAAGVLLPLTRADLEALERDLHVQGRT